MYTDLLFLEMDQVRSEMEWLRPERRLCFLLFQESTCLLRLLRKGRIKDSL